MHVPFLVYTELFQNKASVIRVGHQEASGESNTGFWSVIRMSYKALKKLLIWERKQKKVGCPLPPATNMADVEEIETVPSVLLPCSSCNRTFRPEALAKHAKVCEKTLLRKRKQFDSAKQRIAGTDLAQFVTTQSKLNLRRKPPSPKEAPSKWKEKHEQLVATIRSSRSGEVAAPKKPADHEQCPHCQRYFGPKPYDRHVEWCKEQQHKAKAKGDSLARERLQARTKYQAPLLKSSRTLTKEKFSPSKNNGRLPSLPKDDSSYKTVLSSESSSPPTSRAKMTSSDRVSTTRCSSLKLKSPVIPRRRTPSVCSGGGSSSQSDCALTSGSPRRVRNPAQRELDKYDPFVSAELQMMELLKGDNGETKQAVHIVQSEPEKENTPEVPQDAPTDPNQLDDPEPPPVGPGRLLSLSTLSLCSTVSIESMDLNANNRVRRAASASRIKPSMQSLLYGEDKFNNNTSSSADLAACEAELLESMIEFEKILNSPLEPNPTQPHIDSAYSSLSRRSPGETNGEGEGEPSRFCHECGGRYPVPSAKFCCLCGVRRLAIA